MNLFIKIFKKSLIDWLQTFWINNKKESYSVLKKRSKLIKRKLKEIPPQLRTIKNEQSNLKKLKTISKRKIGKKTWT